LGKTVSGKNMIRALKKLGFEEMYFEGSHAHLRKESIKVTIPCHGNEDLKIGTLNNILKTAKVTFQQIKDLIK